MATKYTLTTDWDKAAVCDDMRRVGILLSVAGLVEYFFTGSWAITDNGADIPMLIVIGLLLWIGGVTRPSLSKG